MNILLTISVLVVDLMVGATQMHKHLPPDRTWVLAGTLRDLQNLRSLQDSHEETLAMLLEV